MASQYFVQHNGQESGPIGFRDLVELVRKGQLVDSDLVRDSWTNEWKPADSVVGLFHMAKRSSGEDADLAACSAVVEPLIPIEPIGDVPEVDVRPGWMKRLLYLAGLPSKKRLEIPSPSPQMPELVPAVAAPSPPRYAAHATPLAAAQVEEIQPSTGPAPLEQNLGQLNVETGPDAPVGSSLWSSTVEAALASVTARQSGSRDRSRGGRWRRLLNAATGKGRGDAWLRVGYRVVCTLVLSATVAICVENWSQEQGRRFPRGPAQRATIRIFPLVGKCGVGEYLFLMADLVLVTGAAAYFAAGWIESRAE